MRWGCGSLPQRLPALNLASIDFESIIGNAPRLPLVPRAILLVLIYWLREGTFRAQLPAATELLSTGRVVVRATTGLLVVAQPLRLFVLKLLGAGTLGLARRAGDAECGS